MEAARCGNPLPMAYFVSLGRISVAPRLHGEVDARRVTALAPSWAVADPGDMLVLEHCPSIEAVVADLRRVVRGYFKPRGLVLDGVQVVELVDGSVACITVRANRVSVRRLLDPAREKAIRLPCDVIALERWRSRRTVAGDAPAG